MSIKSAGVLLYREKPHLKEPEIFLVRANTPNYRQELWGVPKGRTEDGEQLFDTAIREFREETGCVAPVDLNYQLLAPFKTVRGKTIHIYTANSGNAHIEWAKSRIAITTVERGGKTQFLRETRDGKWFPLTEAYQKIGEGQRGLIDLVRNHYYQTVNN